MLLGDEVPARERFEYWRALLDASRPSQVMSAHVDDFQAEARHLDLGSATMLWSSFPPTRFRRTPAMARRADPGMYHVTLLLDGVMALTYGSGATEMPTEMLSPGDLTIANSAAPFDLRSAACHRATGRDRPRVDAIGVDIPAAFLPLPAHRLRSIVGRSISGKVGMGALLAEFLVSMDRRAASLGPHETSRLGTVVADLVTAWLARELDAEDAAPDETRRRALMESIRTFVRRNLHDPDLSPPAIAAAHHVSVSYLHRLFAEQSYGRQSTGQQSIGQTVAAWIRTQRLEGAHRDLADPALRSTQVHAVAARWGMPSASEFSRSFRAAYGISPSEHRKLALSQSAEQPRT